MAVFIVYCIVPGFISTSLLAHYTYCNIFGRLGILEKLVLFQHRLGTKVSNDTISQQPYEQYNREVLIENQMIVLDSISKNVELFL